MWWLCAALANPIAGQTEVEDPRPLPFVHTRRVHVDLETNRVEATWWFSAARPGWLDLALADAALVDVSVTVDGRPAQLAPDANHRLVLHATTEGRIDLSARLTGRELRLLSASAGTLSVDAGPGMRPEVIAVDGALARHGAEWWTTASSLRLSEVAADRALPPPLSRLDAQVGLTVQDAEVAGRARLRWKVLRGEVRQFVLEAHNLGPDAQLTGPATITRRGNQWDITLDQATRGVVDLELRWSLPLSAAAEQTVALPSFRAPGARIDQTLLLSRDSAMQVVPTVQGARSIRVREAEGALELVDGTPTVAWTGPTRGRLNLLRFDPAEQPPMLVDVADWWLSTNEQGRQLSRGVLTIRNERAAALEVALPPGHRLLSVTVDGVPRTVAPTPRGIRIPLPRSIDTVQGPLAFPVELVLLGDGNRWTRTAHAIPLPGVGAPVAVRRVRVQLPPGWRDRGRPLRGQVDDFVVDASLAYGFGDSTDIANADATYRDAVDAWMSNDFETAQSALDELRDAGLSNDNVARLQSNLDLVQGDLDDDEDSYSARNVREQAWARGEEARQAQEKDLREAERKEAEGDYDGATILYERSLGKSAQLAALEQSESVEQERLAEEVQVKLKKVRRAGGKRKVAMEPPKTSAGADRAREPEPDPVVYEDRTEIRFDDIDVSGELVKPMGALMAPAAEETLEITSTAATVILPTTDITVRLQHRLIPAWDDTPLSITARPTRTP